MGKTVKAVKPFIYKNNSNFKLAVYKAWENAGGGVAAHHPFRRIYKSLAYHVNLPSVCQSGKVAHLCFVEGASLPFDAFPDYAYAEIIPMIWDCWPDKFEKVEKWIRSHHVRSAIFTSSQTAELMKACIPNLNVLTVTEGIETNLYKSGKKLADRQTDYLEFGRCSRVIDSSVLSNRAKVLSSHNETGALQTRQQLIDALSDSKITIALTRNDTQPEMAQGIETLTQRYWECMLSRVVMVGHAPQELVSLVGYNPVVEIPLNDNANETYMAKILMMLQHIYDYQPLVDRNRETALRLGDWTVRVDAIAEWLKGLGYKMGNS